MTTQAIQWYANRLKEQELGIRTNELNVRKGELDETVRHDSAVESENYRHNVAQEEYNRQQVAENARHNLAVEQDYVVQRQEQNRHNLAVEGETNRSNVRQEELKHEANKATVSAAAIKAAGSGIPSLAKLLVGFKGSSSSGDLTLWNYMGSAKPSLGSKIGTALSAAASKVAPIAQGAAGFIAGTLIPIPVIKAVLGDDFWFKDDNSKSGPLVVPEGV